MTGKIKKAFYLAFSLISYLLFLVTFCYLIGFVTGVYVPQKIDGEPTTSLGLSIFTDTLLILLFAVQHSVMARPAFKQWWSRIIPEPIERSTYNFVACLCLLFMFYRWEPIGGTIWQVGSLTGQLLLQAVAGIGFLIALISTFLVNHFDLAGLRQMWMYFTDKKYEVVSFRTPFFYGYVRHPLYFGLLLGFWVTPVMTISHLFFAVLTTIYILVGIRYEERDLAAVYGEKYGEYQRRAPMLLPFSKRSKRGS